MLSPNEFRRIALKLEGAIESSHMNHPDFRANGRIFATLGYPDTKWGVLTLTPEQQEHYLGEDPGTFVPAKAKGVRGGEAPRI